MEKLKKIWYFYLDGFREMTVGKTLWAIILIKLFIFFVVIKLIFFPNLLSRDYDSDEARADHVRKELSRQASPSSGIPTSDNESE
ncbi:MAG: DUF4492 domain-containing protein [Muribaculaceae bacterium]|nr:DUF4492 domain-containing protein [Muribaculaceae bacterium]